VWQKTQDIAQCDGVGKMNERSCKTTVESVDPRTRKMGELGDCHKQEMAD